MHQNVDNLMKDCGIHSQVSIMMTPKEIQPGTTCSETDDGQKHQKIPAPKIKDKDTRLEIVQT